METNGVILLVTYPDIDGRGGEEEKVIPCVAIRYNYQLRRFNLGAPHLWTSFALWFRFRGRLHLAS